MPVSPYARSLRRRRRWLLAGILLTLLAVGGLYWVGRIARPTSEADPAAASGRDGTAGEATAGMVSHDFDYTVTDGDRPLFRVRGARVVQDRGGSVQLEDVAITLNRETGTYELTGKRAEYDREQNGARIEGGVVLSGGDGFRLEAEGLELAPGGNRLASDRNISFTWGSGYRGTARTLRADLSNESFVLSGDVTVSGVAPGELPFELRARRALFDRPSGALHAEGEATLQQGPNFLEAGRIAAQVSPDTGRIDQIRARIGVRGRVVAPSADIDRLRFEADVASLLFRDGVPAELELDGSAEKPARVDTLSERGTQRLFAPSLVAHLVDSELQSLEALEGVRFEELPAGTTATAATPDTRAVRRATARRAELTFAGGEVQTATLQKNVVFVDGARELRADDAAIDFVGGKGDFFGRPAIAITERGELRAPKISFHRTSGLVQASDGVQGLLSSGGASGLRDLGLSGQGPVHVEAREASFREPGGHFAFLGSVRAWRGSDVLLADQLRGDEAGGPITASGSVKTLWKPAPAPPGTVGSRSQTPPEPIEIVSGTLVYDASLGVATYSESVVAKQASRVLTCDRSTVRLDAAKQARSIECAGHVRLQEAAGRRVEGETALYDLEKKTVVVRGEPVVLTDPERGRAEGRRVTYSVDGGTMKLSAIDEDPA